MNALSGAWKSAEVGDVAAAVLIPLSKQGKLRVTYNWLYSGLNCDPNDKSDFIWHLVKIDDTHIALSPAPVSTYQGMTLYASVRDDWFWYVQVQAPNSADWITEANGDEILLVEGDDLLTLTMRGQNDQYLTVESELSSHEGHSGYRLRSQGSAESYANTFFMGVQTVFQDGLDMPLRSELTVDRVRAALGAMATDDLIDYLDRNLC